MVEFGQKVKTSKRHKFLMFFRNIYFLNINGFLKGRHTFKEPMRIKMEKVRSIYCYCYDGGKMPRLTFDRF